MKDTGIATKETPIGFKFVGVKKKALIQLMGSRFWGRINPIHWDAKFAAKEGFKAPIQTGEMSSAYLAEMCVNFFGKNFFRDACIECKYVKPIYAGELITTHGVIRKKTKKGSGYRFKVEIWADNQYGEVKTVGWAEASVGT